MGNRRPAGYLLLSRFAALGRSGFLLGYTRRRRSRLGGFATEVAGCARGWQRACKSAHSRLLLQYPDDPACISVCGYCRNPTNTLRSGRNESGARNFWSVSCKRRTLPIRRLPARGGVHRDGAYDRAGALLSRFPQSRRTQRAKAALLEKRGEIQKPRTVAVNLRVAYNKMQMCIASRAAHAKAMEGARNSERHERLARRPVSYALTDHPRGDLLRGATERLSLHAQGGSTRSSAGAGKGPARERTEKDPDAAESPANHAEHYAVP